jgi:hypothetical protein
MKKVRIIEIDDNNNSNIFKNVNFEAVSVTTSKGDEALQDALFEQIASDCSLVLDSGGGNDSRKVLKLISDSGESDNFTYLIPMNNSRAQIQNAKDTYELINNPSKCIFILNQVHNLENVEKEFMFFFGNKDLGISPAFKEKVKYLTVGYTPAFELAAMHQQTITQLAVLAENLQGQDLKTLLYEQSGGDKQKYLSLFSKYRQSQMANDYLKTVLPQFVDALKDTTNVCLANTKGGVGKSTISWQIVSYILENQE